MNYNNKTPRILSSAHGAIKRILLIYPCSQKYPVRELLLNLLKELPNYTQFVILVDSKQKTMDCLQDTLDEADADFFVLEDHLKQFDLYKHKKCTIIVAPTDHIYSIWVQDPFLVVQDCSEEEKFYLVEPNNEFLEMDHDHEISNVLSGHGLFETSNVPLIFHGGNILVGDDFILIGSQHYYLSKQLLALNDSLHPVNKALYRKEEDYVEAVFAELLGADKKLYVVGPEEDFTKDPISWSQPMFHIDNFVSLAGRNEAGDYVVLVGTPVAVHENDMQLALSLKKEIDVIARSLRDEKFIVIRNPIPIIRENIGSGNFYYCLYNNCLTEITPTSKTVWLPSLTSDNWEAPLLDFETENFQIWKSMGFKVIPLMDFRPFIKNKGGPNCLVKYLERNNTFINH